MSSAESLTRQPGTPGASAPGRGAGLRARLPAVRLGVRHLALAGVLVLSAVLDTHRLSQNGYANIYYSAGVKSMLHSLHNFFFVSYDPGGLVTVDKPPLGLWVEAASAKAFGFSPMSLLLPNAVMGVLAVWALYLIVSRRFGWAAGVASALALAVFPSFVAISRDTGVDTLMILLMLLACGAAIRATESGRLRTLILSGVLVGLAFNTKTLAGYLVVPGIALGYLLGAPGPLLRRATQLLLAGLVMLAVSFAWMAAVELTPASQRPYVGSSTNNSELGLTFQYNGFGRVQGQVGGPGRIPHTGGAVARYRLAEGALARADARADRTERAGAPKHPRTAAAAPRRRSQRAKLPVAFPGPTGPLRLFGTGLGDQGGWFVPLAFFGMIGLALVLRRDWAQGPAGDPAAAPPGPGARAAGHAPGGPAGAAPAAADPGTSTEAAAAPSQAAGSGAGASAPPAGLGRRDPRFAATVILGGWFLVEAIVLSLSHGIVHPYYISALAPGAAAMVGAGSIAFVQLARSRQPQWRLLGIGVIGCALAGTVAAEVVILHKQHYLLWFVPVLLVGTAAAAVAIVLRRRLAPAAIALTVGLLLVAPGGYASTSWLAPVEGTFPAAGPRQAAGTGGVGFAASHLEIVKSLLAYVSTHHPGSRWVLLTDAANTAAPMILLGYDAGSLAGYSGTDPVLDGRSLARLISRREARYVVLGGQFSSRGGNRATAAVLRACVQVPPEAWHDPALSPLGLVPYDCAGRERALSSG